MGSHGAAGTLQCRTQVLDGVRSGSLVLRLCIQPHKKLHWTNPRPEQHSNRNIRDLSLRWASSTTAVRAVSKPDDPWLCLIQCPARSDVPKQRQCCLPLAPHDDEVYLAMNCGCDYELTCPPKRGAPSKESQRSGPRVNKASSWMLRGSRIRTEECLHSGVEYTSLGRKTQNNM